MKQFIKLDMAILQNPIISDGDKITLAVISNLSQATGFCFANNQHIAKITSTTSRNVQRRIKSLVDNNFVCVKVAGNQRKIFTIDHDETDTLARQNGHPKHDNLDTLARQNGRTSTTDCTPHHDEMDTPLIYKDRKDYLKDNEKNTTTAGDVFLNMYEKFNNFETPKGGQDLAFTVWQNLLGRGECEQDIVQGVLAYGDYCNEQETKTKSVANILKDGVWKDFIQAVVENTPQCIFSSPNLDNTAFTQAIRDLKHTYGNGQYESFIKTLYLTENGIYAPNEPVGKLAKKSYLPTILQKMGNPPEQMNLEQY